MDKKISLVTTAYLNHSEFEKSFSKNTTNKLSQISKQQPKTLAFLNRKMS